MQDSMLQSFVNILEQRAEPANDGIVHSRGGAYERVDKAAFREWRLLHDKPIGFGMPRGKQERHRRNHIGRRNRGETAHEMRRTSDTRGDSKVGGVIQFRFGAAGFDMKVLDLKPAKRVLWQVVDGPEEWLGTKISFDIKQNDDLTIVLFKHSDWKEPVEFMHHCSTKWAVFLLSLKSPLETGKGAPWPNEIKLDNWE